MARKKRKKIKIRRRWRINPRARVKKSNKIYKRTRAKSKHRRMIKDEA